MTNNKPLSVDEAKHFYTHKLELIAIDLGKKTKEIAKLRDELNGLSDEVIIAMSWGMEPSEVRRMTQELCLGMTLIRLKTSRQNGRPGRI